MNEQFEVGDIVEINEMGWHEPSLERTMTGRGRQLRRGEHGVVTGFSVSGQMVHVTLRDDQSKDVVPEEWLDLVHRPINDPVLYERSLL